MSIEIKNTELTRTPEDSPKEAFNGLSETEQAVIDKIRATEPLLNSLADQLVESSSEWNVIIGDDAGGRLPTHFIRKVLGSEGREVRTFFVAGSSAYRKAQGDSPYENYFEYIAKQIGEPLRPLIVTESVGTGGAVDNLRRHAEKFSSQPVEVAALAVRDEVADSRVDYRGGIGPEAMGLVYEAYESPVAMNLPRRAALKAVGLLPESLKNQIKRRVDKRIQQPSPNRTVGIEPDLSSERPVVKLSEVRSRSLAQQAFVVMSQMVESRNS